MSMYDKIVVDTSNFMFGLQFDDAEVVQYPYRTAEPERYLFPMTRDEDLEEFLASKANKRRDNHTLYVVKWSDGKSVSIRFSDSKMYLGLGVIEKPW